MKLLIAAIALLISINTYGQKYSVGLVKKGSRIETIEGQIVVTDSTVTSTFDGLTSALKITSRKGFTIHVTDGPSLNKYVISLKSGRLHGFTYDHTITYEPDKKHSKAPVSVFLCVIQRN